MRSPALGPGVSSYHVTRGRAGSERSSPARTSAGVRGVRMDPSLGAIAWPTVSSRAPRSYPLATDPTDLPLLRGEAFAGWLLGRLVIGSAAWVLLGAAACGLLALVGLWQPVVAAIVLMLLAAVS